MEVRRVAAREARANFAEITDEVRYSGNPVIVEKQGKPFVAVVSVDDLALIEESRRRRAEAEWVDSLVKASKDLPPDLDEDDEAIVRAVKRTRAELYRERHGRQ